MTFGQPTSATIRTLTCYADYLPTISAAVLEPVKAVPTGWNMLVRHPDGSLVEYVEHRDKHPEDFHLTMHGAS